MPALHFVWFIYTLQWRLVRASLQKEIRQEEVLTHFPSVVWFSAIRSLNRLHHESQRNKPHKLYSLFPEPRAEVYCLKLNWLEYRNWAIVSFFVPGDGEYTNHRGYARWGDGNSWNWTMENLIFGRLFNSLSVLDLASDWDTIQTILGTHCQKRPSKTINYPAAYTY